MGKSFLKGFLAKGIFIVLFIFLMFVGVKLEGSGLNVFERSRIEAKADG